MQGHIATDDWQTYLNDFSRRNAGRTARLEVLSETFGVQGDDVERLPLQGITLDKRSSLTSSLEIMLGGGGAADMRHLTHTVPRVRSIVAKFGPDAREDALEIESEDGDRTILVFETLRELPENL
jgi:Family of unknown function (DUF5335)